MHHFRNTIVRIQRNRRIRHISNMVSGSQLRIRNRPLSKVTIFCLVMFAILLVLFLLQPFQSEIHVLVINSHENLVFKTSKPFLSVALDASVIAEGFKGFRMHNKKLRTLMRNIGGGYLRIGGTLADRLIFIKSKRMQIKDFKNSVTYCDSLKDDCNLVGVPNFTMSAKEWNELNKLATDTGFTILFDLNVLLRKNGSWNSHNAESLIEYSNRSGYNVIWELGNEPTSFYHKFGEQVSATQLAQDFQKLRSILRKYERYRSVAVVGPDIGRPDTRNVQYLTSFLQDDCPTDITTWHHYYFSGSDASMHFYINPDIFDVLKIDARLVNKLVHPLCPPYHRIWLGETSDASGGGSAQYSDKFLSTFIWLDKLGMAAREGIEVVVRQSLFKGHYALIDSGFQPNPNWWITYLHKKLVGNGVVNCILVAPPEVRLYCQCSTNLNTESASITIFGVNLKSTEAMIRIEESESVDLIRYNVESYVVQTYVSLLSKYVFVNEKLVEFKNGKIPEINPVNSTTNVLIMPPFSIGFWVVTNTYKNFLMCL